MEGGPGASDRMLGAVTFDVVGMEEGVVLAAEGQGGGLEFPVATAARGVITAAGVATMEGGPPRAVRDSDDRKGTAGGTLRGGAEPGAIPGLSVASSCCEKSTEKRSDIARRLATGGGPVGDVMLTGAGAGAGAGVVVDEEGTESV